MSTDLILIKGDVPAHISAAANARELNADALAGVSTGRVPSIRTKNGRFRLIDAAGEEVVVAAKDLREAKYLPVIVLAARKALPKAWFLKPYDPNLDEPGKPDCFSDDGIRPNAEVETPVCTVCSGCPNDAYGSGKNARGEATKGKACADNKILAVFYNGGVYELRIKPASLKNWGAYVSALDQRGWPLGHIITFVSIAEDSDYTVLEFAAGGFVPEAKLGAVAELAAGPDVAHIIKAKSTGHVPSLPSQPAVVETTPEPEVVKQEAKKEVAKEKAAKKEPVLQVVEPEVVTTPATTGLPSDAELDDILGL